MSILDDDVILATLQDAVAAAMAASTTPTLPVKYIGRSWVVPDDQKWLELVFIPNNTSDFWGNEKNYRGMFRMVLHWPNDDEGAYPPMAVLKSIASYFTKDRHLQSVQIYETPNLGGVLEDGPETLYPASLRYQSFRS
jgi:hypothetical protein